MTTNNNFMSLSSLCFGSSASGNAEVPFLTSVRVLSIDTEVRTAGRVCMLLLCDGGEEAPKECGRS